MIKRPLSISIISWILIVSSVFSLLMMLGGFMDNAMNDPNVAKAMEANPLSPQVQKIIMYIGVVIGIACGAGMLKGRNEARMAYTAWTIISLIIGVFTSPSIFMIIPGILFAAVIFFFLFRPKANLYFAQSKNVTPNA